MLICLGAGPGTVVVAVAVAVPEGGGAGVPSHRKLLVVRAKGEKIFSTLPAIML